MVCVVYEGYIKRTLRRYILLLFTHLRSPAPFLFTFFLYRDPILCCRSWGGGCWDFILCVCVLLLLASISFLEIQFYIYEEKNLGRCLHYRPYIQSSTYSRYHIYIKSMILYNVCWPHSIKDRPSSIYKEENNIFYYTAPTIRVSQ